MRFKILYAIVGVVAMAVGVGIELGIGWGLAIFGALIVMDILLNRGSSQVEASMDDNMRDAT